MCSCVRRSMANLMGEKKPLSLGGYTHGEELIINLLSTFFSNIFCFNLFIFWININFLDNKMKKKLMTLTT